MDALIILKELRKLTKSCLLNQRQKTHILQQIDSIEHKCYDSNLYVGIVGEFSSGKSTLINALIGRDYFVTNSIQGTTTVVTSISYGNSINLELRYKNGDVEKYSNNKLPMIERFLPDEYAKLSFTDKVKIKAGDFFGVNGKDELMLKIFDIVTTSDKLAEELDEVSVRYPADILKTGIVLLDTPGTDSLNPSHTQITVKALSTKCDMALIIIPSGSPVSITLADFISEHLIHCLNDCHFLVTKIELIRKEKERAELMNWITHRLKDDLGVEHPSIIPAPTLLSLEERHIIEPTEILEDLKQSTRQSLTETFNKAITNLFNQLSGSKHLLIQSSVKKQLKDLKGIFEKDLLELFEDKKHLLIKKQANRTPSLESLINQIDRKGLSMNKDITLERLRTRFYEVRNEFELQVNGLISEASSKDEIQASIGSDQSNQKGLQSFQICFEYAVDQTNKLIDTYKSEISKFEDKFQKAYRLETLEFNPSMDTDTITIKKYNNSFSYFSISTFPLKRMFIKKEIIREEMREAVKKYLQGIFERLFTHYSTKIIRYDEKVSRQVDKLMQKYTKNFTKQINSRIDHEAEEEKNIEVEITLTNSQIQKLRDF